VARKLGSQDDRTLALDARLLTLRITTDVFCDLLRRTQPTLAVYYNSAVDTVEHLFFKYYAPKGFPDVTEADAATYGAALPEVYEQSDRVLQRILSAGAPHADVLVLSDHGQEPATDLGANWLIIKSVDLLSGLGIADEVRATNIGPSVLIRSSTGGSVAPIAARLRDLKTTSGIPVFTVDEHGGGDEIQLRVHGGVEKIEGATVTLGGKEVALSTILEPSGRISGVHRQPAVLIMAGPDIESGVQLQGKTVFDVAPTILALLRLPVARDLHGSALSEAFKADADGLVPVRTVDTFGTREGVTAAKQELDSRSIDNLRSLGYIE
jgi:hypothetical protein